MTTPLGSWSRRGSSIADRETCTSICRLLPTGDYDDWDFDLELDSVECRLYHAGPPARQNPMTHCPHASVYNVEHCGVDPANRNDPAWPCTTFCNLMRLNCEGLYANDAECRADCETFPEVTGLQPGEVPQIYPVTGLQCPTR